MIPYQGLLFFYLLGLLLLPAILLGLLGKSRKLYGMLFTALMLCIVFATNGQLPLLVGFYLWQMAICLLFWRCKGITPLPALWTVSWSAHVHQ